MRCRDGLFPGMRTEFAIQGSEVTLQRVVGYEQPPRDLTDRNAETQFHENVHLPFRQLDPNDGRRIYLRRFGFEKGRDGTARALGPIFELPDQITRYRRQGRQDTGGFEQSASFLHVLAAAGSCPVHTEQRIRSAGIRAETS